MLKNDKHSKFALQEIIGFPKFIQSKRETGLTNSFSNSNYQKKKKSQRLNYVRHNRHGCPYELIFLMFVKAQYFCLICFKVFVEPLTFSIIYFFQRKYIFSEIFKFAKGKAKETNESLDKSDLSLFLVIFKDY